MAYKKVVENVEVDLEEKELTEEEKLEKLLNDSHRVANRCQEIGLHFRRSMKELYENDSKAAMLFLRSFDTIPDTKNLFAIVDSEYFKENKEELAFFSTIIYTLSSMKEEEREIVWTTYFYDNAKKKAMMYKSKSSYYRMRNNGSSYLVKVTNSYYNKFLNENKDI